MNDDSALGAVRDCLTTAKDCLTEVHMNTPLDTVVRHGRVRRWRRRLTGLAGAAAVAAGAVLAVTALAPASHQPTAQPAAWTVARQAGGAIHVTIRELSDPAGLQRKLRADGVLASVTFASQRNRVCHAYPVPWTVAKQAGGAIHVTINELSDPAGLQRKLRADGVLASVTFASQQKLPASGCSMPPAHPVSPGTHPVRGRTG
jgi:hypothetical protein